VLSEKVLYLWITFLHEGCSIPYNDNTDMEYIKTSKIIKNGTSLAVVIPKNILVALHMERGDQVVFGIVDPGVLCIKKVTQEDLTKWKT